MPMVENAHGQIGQQGVGDMGQGGQAGQQMAPNMANMTVSLSQLVDLSIHKAYHELVILAEILSTCKDDLSKKHQIVNFVKRTRRSFIRLIALVKWAQSVSKINKCTAIRDFLDEQSFYFTDTAVRTIGTK